MSEQTTASSTTLSPPPGTGPAPGQVGYENGSLSLNIPQDNGGLPSAINTSMAGNSLTSPMSAGVRRMAPEPNKRALYVGGLDPRVTEDVLKQIFETTGHVQNVKIIPDKNFRADTTMALSISSGQYQTKGYNYGFVEYDDPQSAERALQTLNGRRVHQQEIRVNWAYQSSNTSKEDTSNHFHIFVGDLSNEVNDEVLQQAFSAFGSVSEARVMWDMKTGRSRGYGFVAFRERGEAEKALSSMDGEWLGSRAIRCNWANQKGQPSYAQQQAMASMGITPTTPYGHHTFPTQGTQSFDMVLAQTPQWQTTCYVGNLTPYTTQNDLVPLFQNFGYATETRFQADRGFAFVKMDTHDNAAMAICQLNGYQVNGRPLKCSWGKDRPPTGQFEGYSPATQPQSAYPATPQTYFPQYGQPAPMSANPMSANPMSANPMSANPMSANPMSPQAATPGQFQHPSPGSWQQPNMTPQGMHPPPGTWPPQLTPQSAGGFQAQHPQGGYMGQPQPAAPFGRGYGGYQG